MNKHMNTANCSGGAVYGMGVLGAFVYYLQHAPSLQLGLLGLIKAIFWPALFVYKMIELMGI